MRSNWELCGGKKLVRPINALISFIVLGSGKFLITIVLASPGLIPCSEQISYPR